MSGHLVDPADLVGATEIAIRVGVIRNTVSGWARRDTDFPKPAVALANGRLWLWPEVADWITRHNRGPLSELHLTPDLIARATSDALTAPAREWAAIASKHGFGRDLLNLLVLAAKTGQEFGGFTRRRRSEAAG